LEAMHRRGHRGPRKHETLAAALASFRLLPAETRATPELLAHLGRQGIAEREGRFLYRFDPDANGARRPVDGWALLPSIQAPTLPKPPPDAGRAGGRRGRSTSRSTAGSWGPRVRGEPYEEAPPSEASNLRIAPAKPALEMENSCP